MRIPLFGILALLGMGIATADVDTSQNNAENTIPDNSFDLLSTLQEFNKSLVTQISELQMMETTEERTHLIQHYTAQKKNIESEIALIQSIQASSHTDPTSPRHILKKLSGEEKTVPKFLSIFKKPKNPNNEQSSDNVAYAMTYPAYYPGYGQQYTYPYFGSPIKPEFQYPNSLVHDTFPGHRPESNQQTYPNDLVHDTFSGFQHQAYQTQPAYHKPQQIFTNAGKPFQNTDDATTEIITLPGLRASTPTPQVQLQVQPTKPEPEHPSQPQFEAEYRPQLDPSRPLSAEGTPNQKPLRQYQGVFVYYPNGVINDEGANDEGDNDERITIGSRFGQAIDRVGQVISNLANRQIVRTPEYEEDGTVAQIPEQLPGWYRVRSNRPRSLTGDSKSTSTEQQNGDV